MKKLTDIGRRTFLKATVAAAAAPMILTPRKGIAQVVLPPPSPATTPWVEELPTAITPMDHQTFLTPQPTESSNSGPGGGGECGRAKHQKFGELDGNSAELYEMAAKQNDTWRFNGTNPLYPEQPIWGYAGADASGFIGAATTPGPTIFARYGQPMICRLRNMLPATHTGFGTPEISMHLHNAHTPSESDGFPGDFFSPTKSGPTLSAPGSYKDHFYPNVYAGLESFGGIGDPREALGTLWYHDHTMDFTAPNLVRGMAGFYFLYDHIDSGNEQDPSSTALRLPSHPYDYPLIFQDKRFNASGMLTFDQFAPEGTLGDKITVNGKIEPVLRVARRKYRLRLLNGGPSRFYELYLTNASASASYTFTYIANDGNLLPAPITQFKVRLGVAERGDIVVDFARFPRGTVLYLVNRLLQDSTRKPGNVLAPGTKVLKIIVDRDVPAGSDVSRVPSALRPLPDIPNAAALAALPVRRWVFARRQGLWTINDQLFNVFTSRANIAKGGEEVWELANNDNGWNHPIHIHFEESIILSRTVNGVNVPIPAHERGRKDVFVLTGPNETLRIFHRFRDFKGKYVMHCHNLIHEDHAMMLRWDII